MNLQDELQRTFGEQYMQPEIEECDYWEVETRNGTQIVPGDLVGIPARPGLCVRDDDELGIEDGEFRDKVFCALDDYVEGGGNEIYEANMKHGFIARLQAPGYMDSTEWSAFGSFDEAAEYLIDTYGDET